MYPALAIADEFQSRQTQQKFYLLEHWVELKWIRFQSQDIELLVFGLMVFKGLYQLEI